RPLQRAHARPWTPPPAQSCLPAFQDFRRRPSPCRFLSLRTEISPASHATNAPRANLLRHFGRICLNLWPSLRYLPPTNRVNHEDANRPVTARLSKENNGEGRAGRTGRDRGRAAPRKQGPAAGGTVESAVLRRYRHADRRGRHVVLPENADLPSGTPETVCFGAEKGGRQVFSGHAGRKGGDCRR